MIGPLTLLSSAAGVFDLEGPFAWFLHDGLDHTRRPTSANSHTVSRSTLHCLITPELRLFQSIATFTDCLIISCLRLASSHPHHIILDVCVAYPLSPRSHTSFPSRTTSRTTFHTTFPFPGPGTLSLSTSCCSSRNGFKLNGRVLLRE